MLERKFEPTGKQRDLELETGDKQPVWLDGINVWVNNVTANPVKHYEEQRRLASEGLHKYQGFWEHLIVELEMPRDEAAVVIGRLAIAEYEYQGPAWRGLYDESVSADIRKLLFGDLANYAMWSIKRGTRDVAERERHDELIDALAQSEFWTAELASLVSRYTEIINTDQQVTPPSKRPRFKKDDPDLKRGDRTEATAPPAEVDRPRKRRPEERVGSPEAARMMGIKPQTLRAWRLKGIGPAYTRIGDPLTGRVVYEVAEIERWIAAHTHQSTAEETMNTLPER